MKKNILLPSLLVIALIGCATSSDLKRVRSEFNQKITELGSKIVPIEEKVAALKTESDALRGDVGKNTEEVAVLRKSMAKTSADIADIRDNLQQLRGQLDLLRKDLAAASTHANSKDEEYKEIRDKLDNAVFKINFIENFLGIGGRDSQPEAAEKNGKLRETSKGKPDKESAYVAAYDLFKDGKFEKAREAFLNFLKQYPDTEYSDNAQFWLGECFYFEKKYENAILEYEKVVKNYPDGDRVPHALLKQGISFLNLGDRASAKLILQRVIRDYPNTNQARAAKAQLLKIK